MTILASEAEDYEGNERQKLIRYSSNETTWMRWQ